MSEVYFHSIHRRWAKEVGQSAGLVLVFSPYLTSTAYHVLKYASPEQCEVHTTFSVRNFLTGASSISTLRTLFDEGYILYAVAGLHAKIVIVPPSFVSIGSQNLTLNGTRSKEATAVLDGDDAVAVALHGVQKWIDLRVPITEQMIATVEEFVDANGVVQQELFRAADAVEDQFGLTPMALKVKEVQHNIEAIGVRSSQIPYSLAHTLIKNSAWWYEHPSGRPVRAPGHADHIDYIGQEHAIELGRNANALMIGRAVWRCIYFVNQFLDAANKGTIWPRSWLYSQLRYAIQRSVVGWGGDEYDLYPLIEGTHDMKFGTHSIDTDDFISTFLDEIGISGAFFSQHEQR